jgi:uncharacterized protein (TIGR02996 family)
LYQVGQVVGTISPLAYNGDNNPARSAMSHEIGFLRAILEEPDDDTHRLVYADWLEEQGETPRAEFIRMQCARSRLPQDDPRRVEMYRREEQFLHWHGDRWLEPLRLYLGAWHFRRGFLQSATVPGSAFLTHHRLLFRIAALEHLRLEREPGGLRGADEVARVLGASPLLLRLGSLTLPPGDLSPDGAAALAEARSLVGLFTLNLAGNDLGPAGARALAGSPVLARLNFLDLAVNGIGRDGVTALVAWPHLRKLVSLGLNSNGLGNAGVSILAGSAHVSGLTTLHLAYNEIGPAGARALARSPHLTRLTWLSLDGNPVGNAGAEELLRAPWQQFRGLSVRNGGIGQGFLNALRERFHHVYS